MNLLFVGKNEDRNVKEQKAAKLVFTQSNNRRLMITVHM